MPKIIHCADIHLDAPFSLMDISQAERRRSSLRSAFSSLLVYASLNKADIVLIAGDLFDDSYVTKDTALNLIADFSRYKQIKFFISPGNHDYFHENSPYSLFDWPENVHIFKSEKIEEVVLPELGTRVCGYAFCSKSYTNNPLENYKAPYDGLVNILVGHCDFANSFSPYCPITKNDIAQSGFDYFAMGHIHAASDIEKEGSTHFAYSGCLEGRSFDETGHKGAYFGEVTKEKVSLSQIRFSEKRYEKISVDISGAQNTDTALDIIKEKCAPFGDDTLLRVTALGEVSPEVALDEKLVLKALSSLYYVEFSDESSPILDYNALKSDKTLIGAFFKSLEEALSSSDENERKKARLALKYGLAALNGRDLNL